MKFSNFQKIFSENVAYLRMLEPSIEIEGKQIIFLLIHKSNSRWRPIRQVEQFSRLSINLLILSTLEIKSNKTKLSIN